MKRLGGLKGFFVPDGRRCEKALQESPNKRQPPHHAMVTLVFDCGCCYEGDAEPPKEARPGFQVVGLLGESAGEG